MNKELDNKAIDKVTNLELAHMFKLKADCYGLDENVESIKQILAEIERRYKENESGIKADPALGLIVAAFVTVTNIDDMDEVSESVKSIKYEELKAPRTNPFA